MALQKLRDFYQSCNSNEFNDMLNNKIVVTEKIAAPSLYVRRGLNGFEFFKNGSSEELSVIDRTLVSLYETAIKYFQSLSPETKQSMPIDWKFGFDYMPEDGVASIEYDTLPLNYLILTHIQALGENGKARKIITDSQVLSKWATTFGVQAPPVLFDGMLNSEQKTKLLDLLSLSDSQYKQQFAVKSFTRDAYHVFDSSLAKSALNNNLDKEIDGLIVSFVDSTKIKTFKLEAFDRDVETKEERESSHMYQITIVDLLEFLNGFNFDEIELSEENSELRYIELVSAIYNQYLNQNAFKYVGAKFDSANFSTVESFQLNTNYIKNETTLKYLENPVLAELYKIILGSLRKKRTKETSIITGLVFTQTNEIIDKIEQKIFVESTDENHVHDFKNYIVHDKVANSQKITEALKIDYPEQGKEKVNIFVGRFQPFTLGHVKVLETLNKQNGYPVIVFLVKSKTSKKEDAVKRPYDVETQIEMFNNVQSEYKFLKQVIVVPSAAIDVMFNELRPNFEPVLWGTGTDRMKAYGYMVNNDKYREDLGVLPEFGLYEIQRGDDDISATKVRQALIDGNSKEFNKMTPHSMHSMFLTLKDKLDYSMANESNETNQDLEILTFEQFINKI
jgi:cytidyltransferase-like protein